MASATALYTPRVLSLATSLAKWPWDETLPWHAQERSPTCGSTLAIALGLTANGEIENVAMRVHACAIGQASAAIFAAAAHGLDRAALIASEQALRDWLEDGAPIPDWPHLSAIASARDFPARRGAILLAWRAALAALPSG